MEGFVGERGERVIAALAREGRFGDLKEIGAHAGMPREVRRAAWLATGDRSEMARELKEDLEGRLYEKAKELLRGHWRELDFSVVKRGIQELRKKDSLEGLAEVLRAMKWEEFIALGLGKMPLQDFLRYRHG